MAEEGFASPFLVGPGTGTTYGAVTLGVTIQPDAPKPLALVQFRPEIRYDRVIAGAPLFGARSENGLFNGSRNQVHLRRRRRHRVLIGGFDPRRLLSGQGRLASVRH